MNKMYEFVFNDLMNLFLGADLGTYVFRLTPRITNLNKIVHEFFVWLLMDSKYGVINYTEYNTLIIDIAQLHKRAAEGYMAPRSVWRQAQLTANRTATTLDPTTPSYEAVFAAVFSVRAIFRNEYAFNYGAYTVNCAVTLNKFIYGIKEIQFNKFIKLIELNSNIRYSFSGLNH